MTIEKDLAVVSEYSLNLQSNINIQYVSDTRANKIRKMTRKEFSRYQRGEIDEEKREL